MRVFSVQTDYPHTNTRAYTSLPPSECSFNFAAVFCGGSECFGNRGTRLGMMTVQKIAQIDTDSKKKPGPPKSTIIAKHCVFFLKTGRRARNLLQRTGTGPRGNGGTRVRLFWRCFITIIFGHWLRMSVSCACNSCNKGYSPSPLRYVLSVSVCVCVCIRFLSLYAFYTAIHTSFYSFVRVYYKQSAGSSLPLFPIFPLQFSVDLCGCVCVCFCYS